MGILLFKVRLSQETFRAFINCLLYSFIKAPAFLLLIAAGTLYFQGQLTLSIIESNRNLLDGAAPETVLACPHSAEPYFPSPVNCEREVKDLKGYAEATDKKVAAFYLQFVQISFVWWLLLKAVGFLAGRLPERGNSKFITRTGTKKTDL